MCGLVGVFHYADSGKTPDKELLRRMSNQLKHRGPDDDGYFTEGQIGLGFRRLSIIDLSGGAQPMSLMPCHGDRSKGALTVVFNGEIYNFRSLREELQKAGHRFVTQSDTEVLLHGYAEWGDRILSRLRGMFAFALWDSARQRLFMARDRLGKKPLYWLNHGGTLFFASEIKALLEALPSMPKVNPLAIHDYLTYQYIPSPQTIFHGLQRLPPAHALTCDRKGVLTQNRYWHPDVLPKTTLSFHDAQKELLNTIREAVQIRLEADVPVGAFLSGGVDSSAVVGLMAESMAQPVKTFSIGFEEDEFSELSYARQVAKQFSTDHCEIMVKADMMSVLPKIVWQYDQPYADSSALPSYFVAQETRKHVTVALNGDGGDENFGGYLRYLFDAWMIRWAGISPQFLRKMLAYLARQFPERWLAKRLGRRILNGLRYLPEDPKKVNLFLVQYFSQSQKHGLYTEHFNQETAGRLSEDYLMTLYQEGGANDSLDQIFHADLHSYLPEDLLVKMDVATMTHSLEGRSPFLDHRVVELASSLPSHWKVHGCQTKYILKKALEGFLPKNILYRKKMGFGIPLQKWLKHDYHDKIRSLLLSQQCLSRGYFHREGLTRMLDEHHSGHRDHGYRIWALLMLELWFRVFVDKTLSPQDNF